MAKFSGCIYHEYSRIANNGTAKDLFVLSASITSMYRAINLIRIDERTKVIYFLAGEEIELVILENGEWSFV